MNVVHPGLLAQGMLAPLHRGTMILVGSLLLLLGIAGVAVTTSIALAALFWMGLIALAAGAAQVIEAYRAEKWHGKALHGIIGLIYLAIGGALLLLPASAAYWLTMVLAISLIAVGLIRIVKVSLVAERKLTQWLLLIAAVISIGLGIYLLREVTPPTPEHLTSLAAQRAWVREWGWMLGLFIAVELIAQGLTLVRTAVAGRTASTAASGSHP